MKTSSKGIDFITSNEGLKLEAYLCSSDKWTIGYGHTKNVKEGDVCTEQQAKDWLYEDVEVAEKAIIKHLPNLNQNQFDALVSFVFNVGVGAFAGSTLLKKIKLNDTLLLRAEFAKWKYSKGSVSPGLVKRRKEEADLYFS
jgi:Phage-related lysozyme (muraminidase)